MLQRWILSRTHRFECFRAPLAALLGLALISAPAGAVLRQEILFSAIGDPGTRMGISLSSGGDLNGDGYPDVVAGATGNGTATPRVYIFFGGPAADSVADLVIAPGLGQDFGQAVLSSADLNGDGWADLAVGSFYNAGSLEQAGRVFIYFGGPALDTIPDLIANGEFHFDDFGTSLGSGDVNGDGYADLIVGAMFAGAQGRGRCGKAYVLYGGPLLDAIPDLTLVGEADNDWFGEHVAGAGDVNGDGYDDILVGASLHDANGSNSGRAYLFYGGPHPDAEPDRIFDGEKAGDLFGSRVAGAGDVNGDGYDDFLISAIQHDGASVDDGRVYLYFGGRQPNVHPDLVIDGESAGDILGRGMPAGDVNGDGFADFMVGSPLNDAGGNHAGRVYLFLGGHQPDALPDLVITGAVPEGWLGQGVAAGDMNGDGYGDIAYSALADPTGGAQAGRVTVALIRPVDVVEDVGVPSPATTPAGIRISPSPARSGDVLHVSFAAPLARGERVQDLDVGVYDLAGRHIASLGHGSVDAAGVARIDWTVPAGARGLYLIRASSARSGFHSASKFTILQ